MPGPLCPRRDPLGGEGDHVDVETGASIVKATCVVDNTAGGRSFWGEHGLAFLIETEGGGSVLFDTGQSGTVLLHNLAELKVDLSEVQALALSHGHNDHTGGLQALLARRPGLPLYAHSDLLRERFARGRGKVESVGVSLTREALTAQAELRLTTEPVEIAPGVWTTGEITSRREPEGRSAHHLVRQGKGWGPDPYRDDLSLVLRTGQGSVLLCGCCHAGLLNTLSHVRRAFGDEIVAIVGGTHLGSADEATLQHVATVLREEMGSPRLYLNHCTGDRALWVLATAFGEGVRSCPAGTALSAASFARL
jgi:7,8-dihydropterin-6-yl-methyl-4-(beta-D-ribofuranosyl)aminobenzene 5'-phosphate synthase